MIMLGEQDQLSSHFPVGFCSSDNAALIITTTICNELFQAVQLFGAKLPVVISL